MHDARSRTRTVVQVLLLGWLNGHGGFVALAGTSAVRWWTPFSDAELGDVAEIERVLRGLLERVAGPVEVGAVIVAEDGTIAVVELSARTTTGATTLITSVLTMADGRVSHGRTYADVAVLAGPGCVA